MTFFLTADLESSIVVVSYSIYTETYKVHIKDNLDLRRKFKTLFMSDDIGRLDCSLL